MIDLREISTSWFKNQFLVRSSIRLSRQKRPNPYKNMLYGTPMPELTVTSPYVHSRVDSNTFTHTLDIEQPYARVDCIPQSGTFDMQDN